MVGNLYSINWYKPNLLTKYALISFIVFLRVMDYLSLSRMNFMFFDNLYTDHKLSVFQDIARSGGNIVEELLFDVIEREESSCANGNVASNEEKDSNELRDKLARDAVEKLGKQKMHWVLTGFNDLIRCTKFRGGKLQVFREKAIPITINLAKTENQYVKHAVRTPSFLSLGCLHRKTYCPLVILSSIVAYIILWGPHATKLEESRL